MNAVECMASARRLLRAGALLFSVMLVSGACDAVPGTEGPRVLELMDDTIQLSDSVRLVDIAVRRTASGDFEPASADARSGDVVRFLALDRGGHAIAFDGGRLDAAARDFLERTGQLRSPPLIATDAAWIITLDGAPPGPYPFRCTTHASQGLLTVTAR